jgi:anti-sigma factor RsiW
VNQNPSGACRELLRHISAFLDRDLSAPVCDEIERHCQECSDCAKFVAGLRRTVGLCHEAGQAPLPAAVRARARERVRQLLAEKNATAWDRG